MPFSLNLPYQICYPAARFCRWLAPGSTKVSEDQESYFAYQYQSTKRMRQKFMEGFDFDGATLLDLGSGIGGRSPYWLEQGANRVLNVDINGQELAIGRRILSEKFPSLKDRVDFLQPDEVANTEFADAAILFDTFEHLINPSTVLNQCHKWLRPGGKLWIGSIGWYHYRASHCDAHIPIPWSQVLFSERALIKTIQSIIHHPKYTPNLWESIEGLNRWDQVRTLKDRPGEPLNMLSLRAIEKVLRSSPFQMSKLQVYGFSGQGFPAARLFSVLSKLPVLKELLHSYYTAILIKPAN